MTKEKVLEWVKRSVSYLLGMFLIAFGISIAVKSNLGVSPATSLPYVLSKKWSGLSLGTWTTIVYCVLVLVQLILLRKDFKWYYVLQFAVSTVFGFFVDGAAWLAQFCIPDVSLYVLRLLYTLLSMVFIAFGVTLYLAGNIMCMPAEGVALALSKCTKWQVSTCKTITDMSIAVSALVFSLIFFHRLDGIREGTLLLAFGIGFMMKPINRFIKKPLHQFLYGNGEATATAEIGATESTEASETFLQELEAEEEN